MACFIAPTAAAIIATRLKKKSAQKYHLDWLSSMLWGGVIMLLVDHLANKEIVLFPPFLTAMQNPANIPVILKEIVTTGIAMTGAVVVVWAVMVLVANKASKHRAHGESLRGYAESL
ncbi:MAG: hypothetical protein WCK32_05015 [Chlorobiaceae bacterium]